MSPPEDSVGPPPLGSFRVVPGPLQLFAFSAATWNAHRIHYDSEYAVGHEGYDSILVQGPLLGSWLLELADAWVRGWGRVDRFSYRTVQPVLVGTALIVTGEVVATEPAATASVWVSRDDGSRVAIGQVTACVDDGTARAPRNDGGTA